MNREIKFLALLVAPILLGGLLSGMPNLPVGAQSANAISATDDNAEKIAALEAQIKSLFAELAKLRAQVSTESASSNTSSAGEGTFSGKEETYDKNEENFKDMNVSESEGAEIGHGSTASSGCVSINKVLHTGDSGNDVKSLQQFLSSHSQESGWPSSLAPTGHYGAITEQSVKNYQSVHGIVNEGSAQTTGHGQIGYQTMTSIHNDTCATGGDGHEGSTEDKTSDSASHSDTSTSDTSTTDTDKTANSETGSGRPTTPATNLGQWIRPSPDSLPEITSIYPEKGEVGTRVLVKGVGFGVPNEKRLTKVFFDKYQVAEVVPKGNMIILFTVPAQGTMSNCESGQNCTQNLAKAYDLIPGKYNVTLENKNGTSSKQVIFELLAPAPAVTSTTTPISVRQLRNLLKHGRENMNGKAVFVTGIVKGSWLDPAKCPTGTDLACPQPFISLVDASDKAYVIRVRVLEIHKDPSSFPLGNAVTLKVKLQGSSMYGIQVMETL